MFLLGLDFGGVDFPWASATVICLIVFGTITFCLFVFVQTQYDRWGFLQHPILPIAASSSMSNVAALTVDFFHSLGAIAGLYYLPLYFQLVLGTDPLSSGVWLLALSITYALSNVVTGIYIKKTGGYQVLIPVGMGLLALAYGLLIDLPAYPSWARIIIFQLLLGIAIGMNFQPPLLALQAHTDPQDVGSVTSLFQFLRFLGLAISIVLGQVIFQGQVQQQAASLRAQRISESIVTSISTGDSVTLTPQLNGLGAQELDVVRQALATAFSKVWILYACASFVGFIASFGIVGRVLTSDHKETVTGLKNHGFNKNGVSSDDPSSPLEKGEAARDQE